LRVAFLGTPDFAVPTLNRLIAHPNYHVVAVFTQPDRPKGRGGALAASPVKQAAIARGIPIYQPERIRREESVTLLRSLQLDVIVVVGYGQILPQTIIDIPRHGIINVHASLLPKYRGAAPIQWAIANGETHTGVTTMQIDAGLDTGDMLLQWATPIGPEETAPELSARLAQAGAGLLIETLERIAAGTLERTPQDHSQATLAPILKKEDGLINWLWDANKIHARARGFTPWPGAYTTFRGQLLHVWKCRVQSPSSPLAPGAVAVEGRRLLVGSGNSTALELLEVQLPGRKRMPADAFVNGYRLTNQEILG
jgi:methionyl-tRNA formyltransferase